MNRKALDKLISNFGLALAGLLVVAGGLAFWGYSFANSSVEQQLSNQEIFFPEESDTFNATTDPDLVQWAGMKLTTGEQAQAYADKYILKHMNAASGGKTYSQVSGEYMAMTRDPNADPEAMAALGQLRQTLFMGNTLRGLLLNAYAFWTVGQIALFAAIACAVGAAVMLFLSALGFRHAKQIVV
jgi:hypothetical protein